MVETILPLRVGVIHHVRVRIPAGPRGVSHLYIQHMLKQVYPLNTGEDIHGDNAEIDFKDFYEIHPGFEEFKAYTWNTSTHSKHEFILEFGILPKWVLLPFMIAQRAKEALTGLIGKSKEV